MRREFSNFCSTSSSTNLLVEIKINIYNTLKGFLESISPITHYIIIIDRSFGSLFENQTAHCGDDY